MKKNFESQIEKWKNEFTTVQDQLQKVTEERAKEKQNSSTSATPGDDPLAASIKSIQKQCEKAIQGLSQMNSSLNESMGMICDRVFGYEQYSRKTSLLLHGLKNIPRTRGFDFVHYICGEINKLFPSLRGIVEPIHVVASHPLKSRKGNTMVLIKFNCWWVKDDILRCACDLRGTGVHVTEQLTSYTLMLKSYAESLVGSENVCTYDCMVSAMYNGREYAIRSVGDLQKVERAMSKPPVHASTDVTLPTNTTLPNQSSSSNSSANEQLDSISYILDYSSIFSSLLSDDRKEVPFPSRTNRQYYPNALRVTTAQPRKMGLIAVQNKLQ